MSIEPNSVRCTVRAVQFMSRFGILDKHEYWRGCTNLEVDRTVTTGHRTEFGPIPIKRPLLPKQLGLPDKRASHLTQVRKKNKEHPGIGNFFWEVGKSLIIHGLFFSKSRGRQLPPPGLGPPLPAGRYLLV